MLAHQTMVADDGYEVALFPLEYLVMSQDEGGDYSHQGTYNIDFLGWNSSGRVYQCPIYAPCTMKVVAFWNTYDGGHQVTFQSVRKVHLADGTLDYLTIYFAHCTSPPITSIGAVVNQGEVCYYTGTYGQVTGDHVHSCCGKGQYQGFTQRETGGWDLTNRTHYWNAVYVNNTTIREGYNHNWIEYNGGIQPENEKHKFPWILYARRLRKRRT